MGIKCIIIDDESLARNVVKTYLNEYDDIEIAAECKNGFEGIKAIQEHKPELIFLDIQMPKINGFEMLELIDDPPAIIFTTAFDQYAIKAFEINAVDYLLKPFSKDRFIEAVNRMASRINSGQKPKQNISDLHKDIDESKEYLNRVIIKDRNTIKIVPAEDIKYIQAQDDYVMIYTLNHGNHLKQKTMKYYETHLDPDMFVRIHRSYILNIEAIKNIELLEKESYQAILKEGSSLPISKSGYSRLKELLK